MTRRRTDQAPSFWIVKGNRRMNDLDADLEPGVTQTWITKKPPTALAPGDGAFMWKSSPDRCLVGLAEVTALTGWNDDGFFEFRLRYLTAVVTDPLRQDDLRRDPMLGDASFLKAGPAETLFPLTRAQAGRLVELFCAANPDIAIESEVFAGLGVTDRPRAGDPVRPRSRALLDDRKPQREPSPRALLPRRAEANSAPDLARGQNVVPGKGIRTLTVRQPWAWAIMQGVKDVENRSQPTRIRGTIALHAAATNPADDAIDEVEQQGLGAARRRAGLHTSADALPCDNTDATGCPGLRSPSTASSWLAGARVEEHPAGAPRSERRFAPRASLALGPRNSLRSRPEGGPTEGVASGRASSRSSARAGPARRRRRAPRRDTDRPPSDAELPGATQRSWLADAELLDATRR
jgi:hypothetical protein